MKQRPKGVSVISGLLWFVGIVNIISGLDAMDDLSAFWGGVQVATGAAAIACGWGCWRLSEWARVTTMVLMGVNAVGIIGIWVQYSDRIIVSRVVWPLIINVVVIYYLLQKPVRDAFAGPATPPPQPEAA